MLQFQKFPLFIPDIRMLHTYTYVSFLPALLTDGGGKGSPLQCSCLENPKNRGAWQATCSPRGSPRAEYTEHTSYLTNLDSMVFFFILIFFSRKIKQQQEKCRLQRATILNVPRRVTEVKFPLAGMSYQAYCRRDLV